jgi:hypothetical protein
MPNALPLSEYLYFHPKLQPCHAKNFSLYRISPFCGKKLKKICITNTLSEEKFTEKGKIKFCQKLLQLPTTRKGA